MKALGRLKRLLYDAPIRKCTALKVFDQLIRPILTYGCEIWGIVDIHSAACRQEGLYKLENAFDKLPQERLNLSFSKFLLGVSSKTSHLAVMGELARYPLYLFITNQIKNFYDRLSNMEDESLVRYAFEQQKSLNPTPKKSWLAQAHEMLNYYNIADTMPCTVSKHTLTKQHKVTLGQLEQKYKQYWNDKIDKHTRENNSKLDTYREFKCDFYYEPYLDMVKDRQEQVALTRLRLSNHRLQIERGRHIRPRVERAQRVCKVCDSGEVEDETHFLLHCSTYSDERRVLFNNTTPTYTTQVGLKYLLAQYNETSIQAVARFIVNAFKQRDLELERKSPRTNNGTK